MEKAGVGWHPPVFEKRAYVRNCSYQIYPASNQTMHKSSKSSMRPTICNSSQGRNLRDPRLYFLGHILFCEFSRSKHSTQVSLTTSCYLNIGISKHCLCSQSLTIKIDLVASICKVNIGWTKGRQALPPR